LALRVAAKGLIFSEGVVVKSLISGKRGGVALPDT
jgi:hypothetical protein